VAKAPKPDFHLFDSVLLQVAFLFCFSLCAVCFLVLVGVFCLLGCFFCFCCLFLCLFFKSNLTRYVNVILSAHCNAATPSPFSLPARKGSLSFPPAVPHIWRALRLLSPGIACCGERHGTFLPAAAGQASLLVCAGCHGLPAARQGGPVCCLPGRLGGLCPGERQAAASSSSQRSSFATPHSSGPFGGMLH